MKIAVTYANGIIFQHFGHTQQFKVYEVQNDTVISSQIIDTNGSGHGALAGLLASLGVDVLICGGIGGGAQMALADANIRLFGGVAGDADEAVAAFLSGGLDYNPNVRCNHHGEHHHSSSCGSHGCGSHNCGDHH
jgi:predicted Fe-Mo cluster-binding NifX family protein